MVGCLNCGGKRARKGSLFCTNKCGCDYAEELAGTDDTVWCDQSSSWEGVHMDTCHGCGAALPAEDHPTGYTRITEA